MSQHGFALSILLCSFLLLYKILCWAWPYLVLSSCHSTVSSVISSMSIVLIVGVKYVMCSNSHPRLALIEPQAKTECCPLSIFSHVSYVCFISSYLNFNLSTSPQNPPDGLTSGRWLLHLPSSLDSPVQSSGFPQGPRGSRITGVGAEQDPCTTSSLSPFFFGSFCFCTKSSIHI